MTTIQDGLLTELEPVVEANLTRHLSRRSPGIRTTTFRGAVGVISLCWVVRTGFRRIPTWTKFPKRP